MHLWLIWLASHLLIWKSSLPKYFQWNGTFKLSRCFVRFRFSLNPHPFWQTGQSAYSQKPRTIWHPRSKSILTDTQHIKIDTERTQHYNLFHTAMLKDNLCLTFQALFLSLHIANAVLLTFKLTRPWEVHMKSNIAVSTLYPDSIVPLHHCTLTVPYPDYIVPLLHCTLTTLHYTVAG